MDFPESLVKQGHTAGPAKAFAVGRLAIWSATTDASKLTLSDFSMQQFKRIAIANPQTAPYGTRAIEALESAKVLNRVQEKLVFGQDIAQTAQFIETQNAQVGIIALSLAMQPGLASKGGFALIPQSMHKPLEHGFVVTKRAVKNLLANKFSGFILSPAAQKILQQHGFSAPQN
jgi:molybdate transport system substrate-binding protein